MQTPIFGNPHIYYPGQLRLITAVITFLRHRKLEVLSKMLRACQRGSMPT